MARRLDVFGRPGACVRVGSAHKRPLAAHGVGCLTAGLNLKSGQLSCHKYLAEISVNVTLNHNQPTFKTLVFELQMGKHTCVAWSAVQY